VLSGRLEGGWGFASARTALTGKSELPVSSAFLPRAQHRAQLQGGAGSRRIDSAGQRLGGNGYDLANLEYIIPLPYDFRLAGSSTWATSTASATTRHLGPRYAIGGGVPLALAFGPIRVDYGINPTGGP